MCVCGGVCVGVCVGGVWGVYVCDQCKVRRADKLHTLIAAYILRLIFSEVTNCSEYAQLVVTPSSTREYVNYKNGS